MPIRLNFLAEEQLAEELRRRDPVKRALLGAAVVIGLVFGFAAFLQIRLLRASEDLEARENDWRKIEKDFNQLTQNLNQTKEVESRLASLKQLAANRFLWANTLDALQQVLVNNVSVTALRVEQSYKYAEATKSRVVGKTRIPAAPATSTEKIAITLTAKDYGNPTAQNYSKFKDQLAALPHFKSQLPDPNSFRFRGFSQPTVDKDDLSKSYVSFTLECSLPEKVR